MKHKTGPSEFSTAGGASSSAPEASVTQKPWLGKAAGVITVCVIALGLRLGMFLAGPAHDVELTYYGDSPRYLELANNLLSYGVFGKAEEASGVAHIPLAQLRSDLGQIEQRDAHGLRPEIFRTPGYPAFIAGARQVGLGVWGVLVLQCVLSTAGVVLVYLIGERLLGSHWAGLAAAAVVALHPADWLSANSVLSETLFTTVMLLGLYLSVSLRGRGAWAGGGVGLVVGLSVLVRPITILLGPAIGLWMVATDRRWRTVGIAAVLSACSLLPAGLWMGRNASVGFGPRISSVPSFNSLFYTSAYMHIKSNGLDTRDDWPATVGLLFNELIGEIQPGEDVFKAMNRLTLDKIAAAPALYAQVIGASVVKLMTDHSVGDFYRTLGRVYKPSGLRDKLLGGRWGDIDQGALASVGVAAAWVGWNVLLATLMVFGLIGLAVRRQWSPLLLLGGIVLYFLITTQATGLERFRLPILGVQALAIASLVAFRTNRGVVADAPRHEDTQPLSTASDTDGLRRAA